MWRAQIDLSAKAEIDVYVVRIAILFIPELLQFMYAQARGSEDSEAMG